MERRWKLRHPDGEGVFCESRGMEGQSRCSNDKGKYFFHLINLDPMMGHRN